MYWFEQKLPKGWSTQGPFGIWDNIETGDNIVCTKPDYVLTMKDGRKFEFTNLKKAMLFANRTNNGQ